MCFDKKRDIPLLPKDTIYYAFSDDLKNNCNTNNIWHKSEIQLPNYVMLSECIILNKNFDIKNKTIYNNNNDHLFLLILGGYSCSQTDRAYRKQCYHWEYPISTILDNNTWVLFNMNFHRVISLSFAHFFF